MNALRRGVAALCAAALVAASADAAIPQPNKIARAPSSASIASRRLYFATRSERESEPVLIWPQPVATARSAMVESSVSPDRCDITAR